MARAVRQALSSSFSSLVGKIRRFVLCHLAPGFLRDQKEVRQGECRQCGHCCELVFRCPFLLKKDGQTRCLIYYKGRPLQCLAFPIDPRDLAEVPRCGYSFATSPEGASVPVPLTHPTT